MPYFPKKHILFIHIPKTGGSTVENRLSQNDKKLLYSGKTNNLLPPPHNKISLQHQPYTTLRKYKNICKINFNKKLRLLTAVRNPYTRTVSDLLYQNIINKSESDEEVFKKLQIYVKRNDLDNHNIPQYKFITDNDGNLISRCTIIKLESLNKNMLQYGFKIIKTQNKGIESQNNYFKYLNDDSIKLINTIYEKDFVLFGYDMITSAS